MERHSDNDLEKVDTDSEVCVIEPPQKSRRCEPNGLELIPTTAEPNNPISLPKTPEPVYEYDHALSTKTADELRDYFISEITKRDPEWIIKKQPNQLKDTLKIGSSGTDPLHLDAFQQKMKKFLLMETFSIILSKYIPGRNVMSSLESSKFDNSLERYVLQCSAKESNSPVRIQIKLHDFAVVTTIKTRPLKAEFFLACVTKSEQTKDQWNFELQASPVHINRINLRELKFIHPNFVTNIRTMLERFVSLYELKQSRLLDAFLYPSSQFNHLKHDKFVKTHFQSIVDEMYEMCAISFMGGSNILLLRGGAGTGKTTFIRDLLMKVVTQNFEYTKSILVCCRNDVLVDEMAAKMIARIKSSRPEVISNRHIVNHLPDYFARFGELEKMKFSVHQIGVGNLNDERLQQVNVVFTTLDCAVDLLHADRKFDMCIVDDASLSLEVEFLPIFRLGITTLLLVGDESLQTNSAIRNELCRENGYSRSLFTRVIQSSDSTSYATLYQQRRMHPDILWWPNKEFYHGKMSPLETTPHFGSSNDTPFWPYTVFQVNTIEDIEKSFVCQLLEFCLEFKKPSESTYGIICGHPTSNIYLEGMIKENSKFKSIEVSDYSLFQGRQKDIIIMTALRPNNGFKLFGFNDNLLIALTRAKQTLILCGNFEHGLKNDDKMLSKWTAIIDDAKTRQRFFDLNGKYDKLDMCHLIK